VILARKKERHAWAWRRASKLWLQKEWDEEEPEGKVPSGPRGG